MLFLDPEDGPVKDDENEVKESYRSLLEGVEDSEGGDDQKPALRKGLKRRAEEPLEADMRKMSTSVWALKLPDFLTDRWADVEEEDVDLGEVRIHDEGDGQRPPRASIILSDSAVNEGLPREYALEFVEATRKGTYAFVEDEDGHVEVNGTITSECTARPIMSEEYRQILDRRDAETNQSKAPILVSADEIKPNVIVPGGQTITMPVPKKPATKQQVQENKTARIPRNELTDLLFKAFEDYNLWTFKGLQERVRQPVSYVREVLQEMAFLHKRGPHNGMYELKPEFRRGGAEGAEGGGPTEAEGSGGGLAPEQFKGDVKDEDEDAGLDGLDDSDDDDDEFEEVE